MKNVYSDLLQCLADQDKFIYSFLSNRIAGPGSYQIALRSKSLDTWIIIFGVSM